MILKISEKLYNTFIEIIHNQKTSGDHMGVKPDHWKHAKEENNDTCREDKL